MQGGMFEDLRRESAARIVEMDLPGYAIGGLSVGEPKEIMYEVLDYSTDLLPEEKPSWPRISGRWTTVLTPSIHP